MQAMSENSTGFNAALIDNDLDSIVSDMLLNSLLPPETSHSNGHSRSGSPTRLANSQVKQGTAEDNLTPVKEQDRKLINPTDLLNLQYTFDADMDAVNSNVASNIDGSLPTTLHQYSQPVMHQTGQPSWGQDTRLNSNTTSNDNSPISDLEKSNDIQTSQTDYHLETNTEKYTTELSDSINTVLKFGKRDSVDTSYTDPQPFILADETSLPVSIQVSGLPTVSRVENQLKLKVVLRANSNTAPGLLANKTLIHLPTASIAREKFYLLNDDISSYPVPVQNQILHLDAFLLSNTHSNKSIYVCDRCVRRELKRASRRKSGLSDNLLWCNNPNRRAIIFNNKQMLGITGVSADGLALEFDLVARIVCFCRHHKENDGFRVMFVIRDATGLLLGKTFVGPIIIKDKKLKQTLKSNEEISASAPTSTPSSVTVSASVGSQESDNDGNDGNEVDDGDQRVPKSDIELGKTNEVSHEREVNSILSGINDISQLASSIFSLNPFGLNILDHSSSSANIALKSDIHNNDIRPNNENNSNDNGKNVSTTNESSFHKSHANKLSRSSSISSHPSTANLAHKSNSIPSMRHFHFPSPTSMSEDDHYYNNMNDGSVKSAIGATSTAGNARKRSRLDIDHQALVLTPGNSSTLLNSNSSVNIPVQVSPYLPKFSPPVIQKVIPSQGPLNGGIEVTLLGKNFKDGQIVKFGENTALSTRCWNDSTLVTYLPPSATTGPVFVTISDPSLDNSEAKTSNEDFKMNSVSMGGGNDIGRGNYASIDGLGAIFTYIDDTDRQLIELALQIVGLRMNGKLEDARNIAKRIVEDNNNNNNNNNSNGYSGSTPGANSHRNFNSSQAQHKSDRHNRHRDYSSMVSFNEALIIDVIKSFTKNTVDLNLSMCDGFGRTLLHHAALKSYHKLAKLLISYGANVEKSDLFGFTPLHFACIGGDVRIIDMLRYKCGVDSTSRTLNGLTCGELLWRNHKTTLSRSHRAKSMMEAVAGNEAEEDYDDYEGEQEANSSSAISLSSTNSSMRGEFDEDTSMHSLDNRSFTDFENFADESSRDTTFDASELDGEENNGMVENTNGNFRGVEGSPGSGSMWSRVLRRFNDEILPRYEDLFPRNTSETATTDSTVRQPAVDSKDVGDTPVHTTSLTHDKDISVAGHLRLVGESRFDGRTVEEEVDDVLMINGSGSFFTQKKKDLQSDKMLLFFWIPLMVLLLCSMAIYKLGRDDNLVQYVGDGISKYIRLGLSKIVLGNERVKASFKSQFSNLQITMRTVNGLREEAVV